MSGVEVWGWGWSVRGLGYRVLGVGGCSLRECMSSCGVDVRVRRGVGYGLGDKGILWLEGSLEQCSVLVLSLMNLLRGGVRDLGAVPGYFGWAAL